MANTSEEFLNSTADFLPSSIFVQCLNKNSFGIIFCYLIMALCFFLGTPANLWCVWLYFCTEQEINRTHVFFLNHTIMTLIYSLDCGVEILNTFIFDNEILWCVISFFLGLSWTGRPLIQTCSCIEKYMAVIHPVTFLRYKGIKYRVAAAIAVWLMAFAYGAHMAKAQNFPDKIYMFVFIIALVVISFCCVSVLCALKHPGPGDKHITKQTSRDVGNQQKINAFNTIFSALLLILFTYLPQAILIFFNGTDLLLFECTIASLLNFFNVFGVIISPLLKLYKDGHIKCLNCQKEIKVKP